MKAIRRMNAKVFRAFPTNRSLMMAMSTILCAMTLVGMTTAGLLLLGDKLDPVQTGEFRFRFILVAVVFYVIALATVWNAATETTRPMRKLLVFLRKVEQGDLSDRIRIPGHDEITKIGNALNATLDALADLLGSVADGTAQLEVSARQLTEVGGELDTDARRTLAEAEVVASSAERVSAEVGDAASVVDQATAGVQQIAMSTADAARVATEGVAAAREAQATVARLGDSSAEIGTIVKLITAIAEQTNLLALNATIEAARVGEAGKGFAVVAGEVKDLAQKTAKATEDITARIRALQEESTSAGGALTAVGDVVDRTYALQTTIAAAVQEQAAATSEIGHHVRSAATVSADIAGNVGTVAVAARTTAEQAEQVRDVSTSLTHVADDLTLKVARYRTQKAEGAARAGRR